ncbi:MAG: hypothetical protein ACOCXG_05175 [Nanoarchaeota archaeon]
MAKVQNYIIEILQENGNRLSRQEIVKTLEKKGIINVSAYRAIKNLLEKKVLSIDKNSDEIVFPEGIENDRKEIGEILNTAIQTEQKSTKLTKGERSLLNYLLNKESDHIRETVEKKENEVQIVEGMYKLMEIQDLPKEQRISIFVGALIAGELTDYEVLNDLMQALSLTKQDIDEMVIQIRAIFEDKEPLRNAYDENLSPESYREMLNLIKRSPDIVSDIKTYFTFINEYFDKNGENIEKKGEN